MKTYVIVSLVLGYRILVIEAYSYLILPGLGGSVLYHPDIPTMQIWPFTLQFKPHNLGINSTHSTPSVYSTLKDVGSLSGIDVDNCYTKLFTRQTYYSTMTEYLLNEKHNVFSLPYDFRYIHIPFYYHNLYQEYKVFIETEFERKHERFIVIAHSTGGLVLQHFLHTFVDKEWVSHYISKVYFVSVPFGGCHSSLYSLMDLSGRYCRQTWNIYRVLDYVPNANLMGGLYISLPTMTGPVCKINDKWIFCDEIPSLFFGQKPTSDVYNMAKSFIDCRPLSMEGLPCVIVHGLGIATTVLYDYDSHLSLTGGGDNLVALESLQFPLKWVHKPTFVSINNMGHSRINSYLPVLRMFSANGTKPIHHRTGF